MGFVSAAGAALGVSLRPVEFLAEILQNVRGSLQSTAACGGPAQGQHLLAHRELIARQVSGKLGDLCRHHCGECRNPGKGDQDDPDNCENTGHAEFLQQPDQRRQHEAQEDRKGHRNEDFPADEQTCNDEGDHADDADAAR